MSKDSKNTSGVAKLFKPFFLNTITVILVFLIVLFLSFSIHYVSMIRKNVQDLSTFYLHILLSEAQSSFENSLRGDAKYLLAIDKYLSVLDPERNISLEKHAALLEYQRTGYDMADIFFIREDGSFISVSGKSGKFPMDSEFDLLFKQKKHIINSFPIDGNNMSILSVIPIKPIDVDGIEYSALSAVYTSNQITSLLLFDTFRDDSSIYVVTTSGQVVFESVNNKSDIKKLKYDVIDSFLSNGWLTEAGYKAMRNDFSSRSSGSAILKTSSGDVYAVYQPAENNDYMLLYTINRNIAEESLKNYNFVLQSTFLIIAILLVLVVGLILYRLFKTKSYAEKKALDAVLKANEAKRDFISYMSHDIRTPLNGIIGMLKIAEKNTDDAKILECLHKIEQSSNHLLSLINNVLDMNKLEHGQVVLLNTPFSLNELLANCITIAEGQLDHRNLSIVYDGSGINHDRLMGSDFHIQEIILNLLSNAIKYTPDGGDIVLAANETYCNNLEGFVTYEISVTDTGIGISADFLPKIFDSFAQEDPQNRTTYKGSGLGLSIAKNIAELLDGNITVKSNPGAGSIFTVTLPLSLDNSQTSEKLVVSAEKISLEDLHVLLVEDNDLNSEIETFMLEENGITVTIAENGAVALKEFESSPAGTFDMILMDVMMPVMDGIEATKKIRALPRRDARIIPIIALTANVFSEDIDEVLSSGMNDYIAKPINMDSMVETLRKNRLPNASDFS